MKIEGAKHLFYELLDQWTDYYKAASELRLKVTEAFANVANGGATNPKLGVLAMLDVQNQVIHAPGRSSRSLGRDHVQLFQYLIQARLPRYEEVLSCQHRLVQELQHVNPYQSHMKHR